MSVKERDGNWKINLKEKCNNHNLRMFHQDWIWLGIHVRLLKKKKFLSI